MGSVSWHLPSVSYNQPADDIPVLFLQRLPGPAIEQVTTELTRCDTSDSTGNLAIYPWIRDAPLSRRGVRAFIEDLHKQHESDTIEVILVDLADDKCIVVASNKQDIPQIKATRVEINTALQVVGEVRRGIASKDDFSDLEPFDLTADVTMGQSLAESKAPLFTGNLKLSAKDQITVISLVHLGSKLQAWKDKFQTAGVKVTIVDTEVGFTSRTDLYLLFEALEKINTARDHIGYIFFIDSVLDDQVIAVSRSTVYSNDTGQSSISLLPVHDLVKIWQAAIAGSEDERTKEHRVVEHDIQAEHGDILRRERIYDPRVFHDQEGDGAPTVWFLQDFTLDEERQIRTILTVPVLDYDLGAEYAYMGHHADSVDELLEFFQRGDVFSPMYDPGNSMLFRGYPRHFFAVDRRIFSDKKVILASCLDFYHPTHQLGWYIGTVPAAEAQTCYINLDIANVGPQECAPDAEKVWLSDLKAYSQELGSEAD